MTSAIVSKAADGVDGALAGVGHRATSIVAVLPSGTHRGQAGERAVGHVRRSSYSHVEIEARAGPPSGFMRS
ncbi:MAG: hypothetical protein JNK47_23980 [Mesorhizobium sp.]|nr:hypothetical protein [Mesorhizobium sp.]MBL8580268.1 hypothetical protein [Mesorhizobium sp.]